MSKATKRKHVAQEVLEEFVMPTENQSVVKVVASKGNNLHEVEISSGDKFLVSMPTKFRKNIWIKRGSFVIVDPIEEGDKVKGEITAILYKEQIKYLKEEGKWPKEFDDKTDDVSRKDAMIDDDMLPPSDDSGDEGLSNVIANPNRAPVAVESTDSEESEDEET
ncbi:probable RNA-binding protein EIF1AD [Liolophura sinensis]|uniref:probable RNA-binding protein EIF1AD n=1 Tax=Liolophura sinensis TaxID=3198878 RepID=UPI003158D6AD